MFDTPVTKIFNISKETQQKYDALKTAELEAWTAYEKAAQESQNFIKNTTPDGATYQYNNEIADGYYIVHKGRFSNL